jgi:hypothetical protein
MDIELLVLGINKGEGKISIFERSIFMRCLKILVTGALCLISLYGCWFIFIPIGPIVRAIQGPRLCVREYATVGERIKVAGGKYATITKLHGVDSDACKTPSYPILANVTFDEEKQLENKNVKDLLPVQDIDNRPEKQAKPIMENTQTSVEEDQRYRGMKGIVLKNGTVIEGQIISMDPDNVKIRTKEGKILSYDFKKEVMRFIAK